MGDYAASYEHTGDEEVKHVNHGDWSWTGDAGTEDTGALIEGEKFYEEKVCGYEEDEDDYEEEEYNYEAGINFELEYSHTCDFSQQVAVEGGSEPIRSASTGHQVGFVEDEAESSKSSKSSQDGKPKLKPKAKKTKGARTKQVKHLQEPPLDASSDPGYGGSSGCFHPEDPRSLSMSLVTSWLQDTALEERPQDGMHAQQGSIPRQRRAPTRRAPPGADMRAHASRRSSSLPGPGPQYEYDTEDCGKTPVREPSGSKNQRHEEDNRVALPNPSADTPSLYRLEAKPVDKVLKFVRTGAMGLAQVSKTAALGSWNASKVAAVAVQKKTMEMKCLAGPVLAPIIQAVVEESKEQLMGPDAAQASSRGRGRGRGPGRGRGRGRGPGGPPMERPTQPMMRPSMPAGPRPGMRPVMRPGMVAGPRPGGMRPVMTPGMPAGPGPGMRPIMRPGMAAGPGPGMRPIMRPGMAAGPGPGMRPVMRPGMRPGMGPPSNQQGMPGQGRGQFRPVGARPMPLAQPIDF